MRNNQKILLALLTGAAAGTALGLLFAPEKGKDTRKNIAKSARKIADTIKENAEEGMDTLADLKEKVYNKMKM